MSFCLFSKIKYENWQQWNPYNYVVYYKFTDYIDEVRDFLLTDENIEAYSTYGGRNYKSITLHGCRVYLSQEHEERTA